MKETGPRRRPDGGGYARGEETRARIIAAAIDVFGSEGYERASTRDLARGAGVNPPALQYYFDSKEGLHRACAEFIIGQAREVLMAALDAANAADSGGPEQALDALCGLLDTMFDLSISKKDILSYHRFMARAQAEVNSPASLYLREQVTRPIQQACARLVGATIGRPAEDETTRLRASLILSQISAFHVQRHNTLALLGWEDFAGERGLAAKAQLRAHTRAALGFAP